MSPSYSLHPQREHFKRLILSSFLIHDLFFLHTTFYEAIFLPAPIHGNLPVVYKDKIKASRFRDQERLQMMIYQNIIQSLQKTFQSDINIL